ncbi:EF-hand domain-containing protein [Marilutibacter maris]|nr:EF-hand domain-containing protein [Lysobacter maris]
MATPTVCGPGRRRPLAAMLTCVSIVLASAAFAAGPRPGPQEAPPRNPPPVSAPEPERAPGPDAFTALDRNADGLLSREEAAADAALVLRFDQADRDDDGLLTAEEFAAMDDQPPLP